MFQNSISLTVFQQERIPMNTLPPGSLMTKVTRHPIFWCVFAALALSVGLLSGTTKWVLAGLLGLPVLAFVWFCYSSTFSILRDWFRHFSRYKLVVHVVFSGVIGMGGYCWYSFLQAQTHLTLLYAATSFLVISTMMSLILMFIAVGLINDPPYTEAPTHGLFVEGSHEDLKEAGVGALSEPAHALSSPEGALSASSGNTEETSV
jgi:hypothetical protein